MLWVQFPEQLKSRKAEFFIQCRVHPSSSALLPWKQSTYLLQRGGLLGLRDLPLLPLLHQGGTGIQGVVWGLHLTGAAAPLTRGGILGKDWHCSNCNRVGMPDGPAGAPPTNPLIHSLSGLCQTTFYSFSPAWVLNSIYSLPRITSGRSI